MQLAKTTIWPHSRLHPLGRPVLLGACLKASWGACIDKSSCLWCSGHDIIHLASDMLTLPADENSLMAQARDWLSSYWSGYNSPSQLSRIRNTGVPANFLKEVSSFSLVWSACLVSCLSCINCTMKLIKS